MIARLLLPMMLASATASAPAQLPSAQPAPPADWSGLAELHLLRRPPANPDLSAFVRDEVAAGRCRAAVKSASGTTLMIGLAVLIDATGHVGRIVPRAIDCVTVEQYAAGLVSRQTRDNVDASGVTASTWVRTTMTFAW